ncbi:MAG: class I SAM-dependent methyltransferase [Candidatus Gygaella obscura]|nr:class I SAM-dependent methyltransferase [Candidatus Gygaella obscura]
MIEIFDKHYREYDNWYERNKFVYLSEIEAIKKLLPSRGIGLEVGVGTGRFASVLGVDFGIDLSMNMLKIARDRKVKVCLSDAENIPFKESFFDYILISVTMAFVENPGKVLQQVKKILKKNGQLVIGIIEKNSLLGKEYRRRKSHFYKQANLFTVQKLTSLLIKNGFDCFSYYQTIFGVLESIQEKQVAVEGVGDGSFVVIKSINK